MFSIIIYTFSNAFSSLFSWLFHPEHPQMIAEHFQMIVCDNRNFWGRSTTFNSTCNCKQYSKSFFIKWIIIGSYSSCYGIRGIKHFTMLCCMINLKHWDFNINIDYFPIIIIMIWLQVVCSFLNIITKQLLVCVLRVYMWNDISRIFNSSTNSSGLQYILYCTLLSIQLSANVCIPLG